MNKNSKIYNVAPYLRLSRDDGDDMESESISNQRDIAMSYISKHNDLNFVKEYTDDGKTGANFERDGWKDLMHDIETGKVNTILTKDLSRMGRDYISMGNYIEKEFPEKNIRYIAINDDVDTLYETPGLEFLQFKLVFNDYYLKDTSKKIRKVMRNKKEEGQYTGWKGIYGYKRNPYDKHKLIVDEEVAPIVKRMFNMIIEGYGVRNIADTFTLEGIPNPSSHANLVRGTKTPTSTHWCPRTIEELLTNPTYIGNLAQGRRKKVSYKSKKEIRVPKEDWIIVKNTHEPIIDEETFNTVQELLKRNKNKPTNKNNYLLRGFLYCKECGHSIGVNCTSDKKRKYCVCNYYAAHSKFHVCTPHTMNYDKLEIAVINSIKELCKEYIDDSTFENKIQEARKKNDIREKMRNEINNIEAKIKQITNNIDKLYVDKLNEIITLEQYMRLTKKFNQDIEQFNNKKEELTNELNNMDKGETIKEQEEIKKKMEEFLSFKNPPRELLINLIDKIEISQDKTVKINYKFRVE